MDLVRQDQPLPPSPNGGLSYHQLNQNMLSTVWTICVLLRRDRGGLDDPENPIWRSCIYTSRGVMDRLITTPSIPIVCLVLSFSCLVVVLYSPPPGKDFSGIQNAEPAPRSLGTRIVVLLRGKGVSVPRVHLWSKLSVPCRGSSSWALRTFFRYSILRIPLP